jgi:integrase
MQPQSNAGARTESVAKHTGIYRRHRRSCSGGKCSCPFLATVYSARERKLIRRQFDSLGAARTWQQDARPAVRKGELKAPTRTTVKEAGEELVRGMESGAILDRSGTPYKPSTVRGYRQSLRDYVFPSIGHLRLSQLDRQHVQAVVDQLGGQGLSASSVRNTLNPLQVICRRAIHAALITVDPTAGLMLPKSRGQRDRIVSPEYAQLLIEALPEEERALWATAFYSGLRIGEIRALRWSDIDLPGSLLHVRRGWDEQEGAQDPKSTAGRRTVPIAEPLRRELADHGLRTRRSGDDLVFGRTETLPFVRSTVRARALTAWGWKQVRNPGAKPETTWVKSSEDALDPLTPHEARHCAASYLIAAGLNAKELSVYIGHSDIRTTYNRYGHLMPGGEVAAAKRLTAFLTASCGESMGKVDGGAERIGAVPSGMDPQ